jgi:hypothetical protein
MIEYSIPISLTCLQLHLILSAEWAHLFSPIIEYSILIRQIRLTRCLNIGSDYEGKGSGLLPMPLYNTDSIIHAYKLTVRRIQQHRNAILSVG